MILSDKSKLDKIVDSLSNIDKIMDKACADLERLKGEFTHNPYKPIEYTMLGSAGYLVDGSYITANSLTESLLIERRNKKGCGRRGHSNE